jgi:hypothetical protein
MMRDASNVADQMFSEGGEVRMFWLADGPDGPSVITSDGVDDTNKDALARQVRAIFRERNVMRYVYVAEAWSANGINCRPSEHPLRREVVFIQGEDGSKQLVAIRDIVRPEGGKPYLAELKIERAGAMEGRLAGLLSDPPVVH